MRLTVKETAQLMGASTDFVRRGLRQGVLPFGSAVACNARWTYYIDSRKLAAYLRREPNMLEKVVKIRRGEAT